MNHISQKKSGTMSKKKISILIIDDKIIKSELLNNIFLENSRFEPKIVHIRNSAKTQTTLTRQKFQIIFLNYILKPKNNLKVYKTIRASKTHYPVIFITDYNNQALKTKTLRTNLTTYLIKQKMSPQTINQVVKQILKN